MREFKKGFNHLFKTWRARGSLALTLILALAATAHCGQSATVIDDTNITEIADGENASLYNGGTTGLLDITTTINSGLDDFLLTDSQILAAVVQARSVISQGPRIDSTDISSFYTGCPDGGTASFAGTLDYTAAEATLDVHGTVSQTLASCSTTTTVTASDGECDISSRFTGAYNIDYAFNYDTTSGAYLIASNLTTMTPVELVQNGVTHAVIFDLFYMEDTEAAGAFNGTVTVDDFTYDVSLDADTSRFTKAELGCE